MTLNPATEDSLRRLFYQGFSAHDIAEPLRSFDDEARSADVRDYCPKDAWKQYLSDNRIHKAEMLLAERKRRNQHLSLADCLQLSDKGQIIARNPELRSATRFSSRRRVEEAAKGFERLRNNLAHAQDIITTDWDTIVDLTSNIEDVITGPRKRQETG